MRLSYLLRRLALAIPLLLGASLIVFLLVHLAPGDPALVMLGDKASPERIAQLHAHLGLDRPLPEQYLLFLGRVVRGDLGDSIIAERPVMDLVVFALPATLELATAALVLSVVISVPVGIAAAIRRGGWFDHSALFVALMGQSIPSYWLGLSLISLVALRMHLVPTSGRGSFSQLILPAITLAPFLIGLLIRVTRTSVLDVLQQDYVRTGRAKGLSEWVVVYGHVLKNALIPVITILGLQVGALLGGAVITETVFGWPGVGQLAVNAIYSRDYPVVQAVILMSAVAFIVINLVVDVLYVALDPRISYQ